MTVPSMGASVHPVHVRSCRLHASTKMARAQRRMAQGELAAKVLKRLLIDIHPQACAEDWVLHRLACGKLTVHGPSAPVVSVSHSGDWVVCAAAHVTKLGIDVECLRALDWEAAADLVLHPTETAWVLAAQGPEQQRRGLQCWTGKEALLKAIGPTPDRWAEMKEVAFTSSGRLLEMPKAWGSVVHWTTQCWRLNRCAVLSVAWQ